MFCPNCGTQKEIDQICGVCNQATESPMTATTVSMPASSSAEISPNRKNAGIMMVAGALLVAVGTALPWFNVSSGYYSINRNAFQFGANLSMTLAPGPIILIMALVMAYDGLRLLGIFGGSKESFSRPTVSTVIVAVDIIAGMTTSFSSSSQVVYSVSFGPLVSILGVAAGVGAIVLMYRDWQSGAHAGNPGKEIGLALVGAVVVGFVLSSL